MLKVYQFGLSKEEGDLVNSKGWNASPKTEAYLGKYKGYQEGTGKYYTYVANVQSNELEEAFHLMNAWNDLDKVECSRDETGFAPHIYSMSVGDVVEKEGEFYSCEPMGFAKINPNEYDSFPTQENYATGNA